MKKKHSELGIASFIIGLLAIVISLGLGLPLSEWLALLIVYAALYMSPLALVLGIAGLKQKDRRILFPILGIAISILILVFWGVNLIF